MKRLNSQLLISFLLLFFLDLARPLGYSLITEFLLLGIIFISLNSDLLSGLILGIAFGLFADYLSPTLRPLRSLELPLICFLNHYLFSCFRFVDKKKQVLMVKNSLVFLALIIHIILNTLGTGLILPLFWIQFFIQSALIYFALDYFLLRNKTTYSFKVIR